MRVDYNRVGVDLPEPGPAARAGQNGAAGAAAGASTGVDASGVDQARFSYAPSRVESLQAQVLAQPEIRDVRVRALQLSIGDGTYTVGPQQIADAIASEVSGVAR